jgi:hypothetical protein
MNGWYLTDRAGTLTKWQFPAVVIEPGESMLVWASDKDRTDPDGELHANFKISRDGEYLGLVKPDGITVASQFAPNFPAQFSDVSYGIPTQEATYSLVSQSSATQVLIPVDNSLGTSWTERSFMPNDSWSGGTVQGVGYDTNADYSPLIGTDVSEMRNTNSSVYIRIPFSVTSADFTQLVLRIRYDDGFVAYINGQEVARRNAPADVRWDSTATGDRADRIASQFETIDLSPLAGLVTTGENVLAIQGLNVASRSSDLLIDAALDASKLEVLVDEPSRYFFVPTPGVPNIAGTLDTRPIIVDVEHTHGAAGTQVEVTPRVVENCSPPKHVEQH